MIIQRICNQENCKNIPKYRYTWPGKTEEYICEKHAQIAKNIAQVIGFQLELIPIKE
jgi:hypothetical protein